MTIAFLNRLHLHWNIDSVELGFFFVLLLALLTMAHVIYPYVFLTIFLFLVLLLIVIIKPMIGIYIFVLVYPLGSVYLIAKFSNSKIIFIRFEEIFSCLLFLAMIIKQLSEHHQRSLYAEYFKSLPYKWIIFLFAFFVFWSIFSLLRSEYFVISLLGLWRFVSSFIIITFLLFYLDNFNKFTSVLIFYCFVCVLYALSSIYATNHAFQIKCELFQIFDTFISLQISLFNQPTQFISSILGMTMGVGLATKHDMALLLTGGIFFAMFLIKLYDSLKIRLVLLVLTLLFVTIIYQVFARISVVGLFLTTIFFCVTIPKWRKSIVLVLLILLVFNIAGLLGSSLMKTTHMKNTESTLRKVESVTSRSEFEPSTLAGRNSIWKKTIERIVRSRGVGAGPDTLMLDMAFSVPHGHNLLLTLAAEYGLPGALSVLLFLIIIANGAYKSVFIEPKVKDNLWLLKVACIAASLHALFGYCFDMPISQKQLWFMLGLLLVSINLDEKGIKVSSSASHRISRKLGSGRIN